MVEKRSDGGRTSGGTARRKKEKHGYDKHKSKPGKIWHFLWHEDSWASFAADIILILLIGKFILYPGIGALFGTDFPVVAVISGSMDHHGQDFDEWWELNGLWYESHDISKSDFEAYYRSNGFKKGDVLFIFGKEVSELELGDVIVFRVPGRADPIIHRVVEIAGDDSTVATKGDANGAQLVFETAIEQEQIEGRAAFLIPKIGWVKVAFVGLFK